jgi:hypothetical protein
MEHRPSHLGHRSAVIWLAGAGWQALWAITACTALANGAYIALFTGFGLRVRHALLFALAYVVILEAAVASISLGKGPAAISIRHYAESIVSHLGPSSFLDFSSSNARPTAIDLADLWPSVMVLVSMMLVGVVATSILLSRQDVA